jgi:hypothetical protein
MYTAHSHDHTNSHAVDVDFQHWVCLRQNNAKKKQKNKKKTQLTWTSNIGFVYDKTTLKLIDTFTYDHPVLF